MSKRSEEKVAREVMRLVRIIAPMMAAAPPEVVAEVVISMAARFIACHHPDLRASVRKDLYQVIDATWPQVVEHMIKDGAPDEWRSPTLQ